MPDIWGGQGALAKGLGPRSCTAHLGKEGGHCCEGAQWNCALRLHIIVDHTDIVSLHLRDMGVGRALYSGLAMEAVAAGGVLKSDWTVSEEARRVYFGLLKRGWTVGLRDGIVKGAAAFELVEGQLVALDGTNWKAVTADGQEV